MRGRPRETNAVRPATASQNVINRGPLRGRFKGIDRISKSPKWQARISVNGRRQTIGYYDTQEEAARAYDAAALRLHGEFARLNFPQEAAGRLLVSRRCAEAEVWRCRSVKVQKLAALFAQNGRKKR